MGLHLFGSVLRGYGSAAAADAADAADAAAAVPPIFNANRQIFVSIQIFSLNKLPSSIKRFPVCPFVLPLVCMQRVLRAAAPATMIFES